MPHIIVKYSSDDTPDLPHLLDALHHNLGAQDTVNLTQIKTYAVPLSACIVSDEHKPDQMIHVQVRMKPGRSETLRHAIAADLHTLVREHVDARGFACAVSVEIHELNEPTYHSSYST